jgi:hypothetical protein
MSKVPAGSVSSETDRDGQTLSSDAGLDALKMILIGSPLSEVLKSVARLVDRGEARD